MQKAIVCWSGGKDSVFALHEALQTREWEVVALLTTVTADYGRIVITGSFNFTKAAEESNAENLLVIRNADLAAKYAKNWQEHLEHSVPYERRANRDTREN